MVVKLRSTRGSCGKAGVGEEKETRRLGFKRLKEQQALLLTATEDEPPTPGPAVASNQGTSSALTSLTACLAVGLGLSESVILQAPVARGHTGWESMPGPTVHGEPQVDPRETEGTSRLTPKQRGMAAICDSGGGEV